MRTVVSVSDKAKYFKMDGGRKVWKTANPHIPVNKNPVRYIQVRAATLKTRWQLNAPSTKTNRGLTNAEFMQSMGHLALRKPADGSDFDWIRGDFLGPPGFDFYE